MIGLKIMPTFPILALIFLFSQKLLFLRGIGLIIKKNYGVDIALTKQTIHVETIHELSLQAML